MAKKKAVVEAPEKGKRKGTRIQFLRDLYSKDANIANQKALDMLLAKFPESNASIKSIATWKKMLRDEGMDIPKARSDGDAGKKVASKKVVKKVKK